MVSARQTELYHVDQKIKAVIQVCLLRVRLTGNLSARCRRTARDDYTEGRICTWTVGKYVGVDGKRKEEREGDRAT